MTSARRRVLLAAAAALVLTGFPAGARAGSFLPNFSGTTRMLDNGAAEGIVNFAVFDNTDGGSFLAESAFTAIVSQAVGLTGSPAIDVTAGYIYLFQVINDNPVNPEVVLNAFRLPVDPGSTSQVTSAGFFTNTVFTDRILDDGRVRTDPQAVGNPSNKFLGASPTNPDTDDPLDGVPSASGATNVGLATIATDSFGNPYEPSTLDLATRQVQWSSGIVNTQGYSSVFFFTTSFDPSYRPGEVGNGDLNNPGNLVRTNGDVPVPTPEPGTLALWSLAFLGVGGASCWRRWRDRPTPAA